MAISKIPSAGFQDNVKFRNLIINGDMSIAQRGTSVSGVTANTYTSTDRFFTELNTAGTWTSAQDTDVPSGQGFVNSMKWSCTTANASLSSNSYFSINQRIEGQNLYYLKFGTSSAESLTASFWVKSNKTGTYIYYIYSHQVRIICKTFTIDSTDTWEKKTITFDGDTISAITSTNALGITSGFVLVAGSDRTSGTQNNAWATYTASELAPSQTVNLADSTSNYINITGIQLEAGTTASDFEFLPVDVNLARCQRYYYLHASHNRSGSETIGLGNYYTSSDMRGVVFFPTEMRTRPSIDVETVTDGYQMRKNGGFDNFDDFELAGNVGFSSACIRNGSDASATAGQTGHLFTNATNAFLAFDSEL